ncbi:hypothetical protein Peur_025543 [Populus x canadensis]
MLDSNEIPGATNPAQLSNRQQHVVYRETLEPVKSQKQQTKFQQQQTFLRISASNRTTKRESAGTHESKSWMQIAADSLQYSCGKHRNPGARKLSTIYGSRRSFLAAAKVVDGDDHCVRLRPSFCSAWNVYTSSNVDFALLCLFCTYRALKQAREITPSQMARSCKVAVDRVNVNKNRYLDVVPFLGSKKPSDHVTDILKDAGVVSFKWRASVVENKGSGYDFGAVLIADVFLSLESNLVLRNRLCVLHIQYPEWPDHGVSTNTNAVREILRRAYHMPPSLVPDSLTLTSYDANFALNTVEQPVFMQPLQLATSVPDIFEMAAK